MCVDEKKRMKELERERKRKKREEDRGGSVVKSTNLLSSELYTFFSFGSSRELITMRQNLLASFILPCLLPGAPANKPGHLSTWGTQGCNPLDKGCGGGAIPGVRAMQTDCERGQ